MGKKILVPILVMALVFAVVAPPAHAELTIIAAVLFAAFGTSIVANEANGPDNDGAKVYKPQKSVTKQKIYYDHLTIYQAGL